MIIKLKKTTPEARVPTRGSLSAAGCDLYACLNKEELRIAPGMTEKIRTGICIEIPEGYVGLIYARSGLATKRGLRPANCVGVIDSDYRGELIVALHNDTLLNQMIENGERVAQLVITPYLPVDFEEVNELNDTDRGVSGFGSTGCK